MRRALVVTAIGLLVACAQEAVAPDAPRTDAPASAAAPAPTPIASAVPAPIDAAAPPAPVASAAPAPPDVARCAPGQLNTPCVFQSGAGCFLRRSNCTELPCTEPAPSPVDCAVFRAGRVPGACDVASKCGVVNMEGCAITPCENKLQTCIAPACAPRVLAATGCATVAALVESTACHGRMR